MKTIESTLLAVQEVDLQDTKQDQEAAVRALSELELACVGGGSVDPVFG